MPTAGHPLGEVWAGPVLRRCDDGGVSVWIALREAASIELRVYELGADSPVAEGVGATRRLGDGLSIGLVTARGSFHWGQTYEYELLIGGRPLDCAELLYPDGPPRLSFVLPAAELERTSLFHGSCRKPSDGGADALVHLDTLVGASMKGERAHRPELFVCSGDAIYADLPSSFVASSLADVLRTLVGAGETLPSLDVCAEDLSPELRAKAIPGAAQIYEGRPKQLLAFGEYLVSHLLVLSPALWSLLPKPPPRLRDFVSTLPRVRRALANTPFYSIFDDHEITDDWYLTRAWTRRALSAPLGHRLIRNGLLAYGVVHGWGNTPEAFESGGPGERILDALEAGDYDRPALAAAVGLPELTEVEDSPSMLVGDTCDALSFYFQLDTPSYRLVGLDTRTRRTFPGGDHEASVYLDESEHARQLPPTDKLQIIVSASPFAPPPRTKTEWGLTHARVFFTNPLKKRFLRRIYAVDRGDEWEPGTESFDAFYRRLEGRWINLGGDTHLSYAAVFETDEHRHPSFVSSGMKRENGARLRRQRVGFHYPYPFGSPPVRELGDVTLRYLRGDGQEKGHYLAKNSIGELSFPSTEDALVARHDLWFQPEGEVASDQASELASMFHLVEL